MFCLLKHSFKKDYYCAGTWWQSKIKLFRSEVALCKSDLEQRLLEHQRYSWSCHTRSRITAVLVCYCSCLARKENIYKLRIRNNTWKLGKVIELSSHAYVGPVLFFLERIYRVQITLFIVFFLCKSATCRSLREIKDAIQRIEGCPPTKKASCAGVLRAQ